MSYTIRQILACTDHTVLSPTATSEDIRVAAEEAITYHTATLCIPPCYVKEAVAHGQGKLKVCTVIGFPNGYNTAAMKAAEAAEAIQSGASEIDMVMPIYRLMCGDLYKVSEELALMRRVTEGRILKVIIETCLLSEDQKRQMCRLVGEAGCDFIKTSTGFGAAGATAADVRLMAECVPPGLGIKAAGGIGSFADAEAFLHLGATRLGTSRLVKILKNENKTLPKY